MSGFLSHVYTAKDWTDIRVNGETVTEMELTAGPFGELGIPVALVTGDDLTCQYAKKIFNDVETVPVKKVINRFTVNCLPLKESHRLLREGARRALSRLEEFEPYAPEPPFTLEIDCASTFTARFLSKLSCLEYDGRRTVKYKTDSYMDLYNMSNVLLLLNNGYSAPFCLIVQSKLVCSVIING